MILEAALALKEKGIKANVVSMPCLDIFLNKSQEYQSSIINDDLPVSYTHLTLPTKA